MARNQQTKMGTSIGHVRLLHSFIVCASPSSVDLARWSSLFFLPQIVVLFTYRFFFVVSITIKRLETYLYFNKMADAVHQQRQNMSVDIPYTDENRMKHAQTRCCGSSFRRLCNVLSRYLKHPTSLLVFSSDVLLK